MSSKYTIPVTFTYQQQPIPSEQVNQNYAYIIAALNAIVDDFRSPASPADPAVGMVWQDSSGAYPVFRIYEDALFKWFGIFVGTTAEKPLNPRKGAVFFDTTLLQSEYYNGSSWVKYCINSLSEDSSPTLGGNLTLGSYTVGAATADDLIKLHGITATVSELNTLDGITATVSELNTLDGITATVDELNYVDGVTSSIQTQLDAKTDKATLTAKGDLYVRDAAGITRLPVGADGEIPIADSGATEGIRWAPLYATADASNVYKRDSLPSIKGTSVAADRYTWQSPAGGLVVGINGAVYALTTQTELDLSNSAHWDTTSTDYTVAVNRKGKDFYVYACEPASGNVPVLLLSASSTYPDGYTADTSRKIGGFHCLCADVGTITGHPLTGFVAGDILPLSVWDLKHRPKSASPEGMVWSEEANIWVDIYLQSGTGGTTASAYNATITDTRTWMDHVDDLAAVNKRLLDDGEFQKIAAGGNEETNIAGSADPGTTGGHTDTAGRRMISAIGCEDCAGVMYQWLSDQSFRSAFVTEWGWYDLPGAKGSLYNQDGVNGRADVKLRAGGYWDSGSSCGSRCRTAHYYRWYTHSSDGARGAAEPV